MSVSPAVGLLWLGVFIAAVVIYTGFKVRRLIRRSEDEWRRVDTTKLKRWDDDDDDWK